MEKWVIWGVRKNSQSLSTHKMNGSSALLTVNSNYRSQAALQQTARHVAYSFLFHKQPMKGRVYKGLGWHLVYWLWPALNLIIAIWNVRLKTRSKKAFPINSQLILSLVSEGKEADLVIEMDAILNYSSEDTEDFYMLLGCDELSSVRLWIMLFFFKFLFKVVTLNF